MPHCPDPTRNRHPQPHARRGRQVARNARMLELAPLRVGSPVRFFIACVIFAAVLVGVLHPAPRPPVLGPYEQPAVSEEAFTEGLDASVLAIGVPMPETPLANWKKPPCSGQQKEINKGCWVKLDIDVGDNHCGEFYEWSSGCYAPIAKTKNAPTSIER